MWIFGHNRSNYGIRYVYNTGTKDTQDCIDFHGGNANTATVSIRLDTGDISGHDITGGGALAITGNGSIGGNLTVTSTSKLTGNVGIGTASDTNYALKVNGHVYIATDLTVKGGDILLYNSAGTYYTTINTGATANYTWTIPSSGGNRYFMGTLTTAFPYTGNGVFYSAKRAENEAGENDYVKEIESNDGALYATSQGGNLQWGTLPVAQGGTNATSVTKFGIAYGNSSANGYTFTAAGTDGYILIGKGTSNAPTWQQTLPIAHGGTGVTTWAKGGIVYASAKDTFAQITDGTANKVLYCSGSATYGWLSYTSSSTASTLVYRDANKNFSAGTITASLSGNATSATKANITSNKYGIAYYSDTAGTFATTAQGTAGQTLIAGGSSAAPAWYGGLSLTGAGTSASPYAASFSNTVQTGGNVGINVAPDTTYALKVTGKSYLNSTTASSSNNLSGQLIVANSTSNGANVAIELWRGGASSNVGSWQIANESAYLYFRSNWYKDTNDNAAKRQDTYGLQSLRLFPETGNGSIPGLAIGQTAQNTSYKLYVNGTSKLDGDTEVGGDLDPGTTASHSIGALAKAWDNIVGNDFYVGANGVRYGRFYAMTEGTTTTTGWTTLAIGNETPTGTANNSRGSLRIYSTNTLYQAIVADEPSGTTPDNRTWHLPSVPGHRCFVGTTTTGFPYTQYGICYAGGDTQVSFTAAGTAGNVLKSGGSSAAPSWYGGLTLTGAGTDASPYSATFSNEVNATVFNGPLTGTVTGHLIQRSNVTKGTNPTSTVYNTTSYIYETGTGTATGNRLAWLGLSVDTNGRTIYTIQTYRYAASNTTTNAFSVGIDADGTAYYAVTNKSAFRTAIGVGDSGTHADSYFALASHGTHVTTATVQSALSIDTSSGSTSKCLTEKGTWASFTNNAGTVTSITLSAGAGITLSATGAITTSGTRTISITDMNTSSGSTTKWLNQKGGWTTPTAANVGAPSFVNGTTNNQLLGFKATTGTHNSSYSSYNNHELLLMTTTTGIFLWDSTDSSTVWSTASMVQSALNSGDINANVQLRTGVTKGTQVSSSSLRYVHFLETGTGTAEKNRIASLLAYQVGGTLNTRIGFTVRKSVASSTDSTYFYLAYDWNGTTEVKRTYTGAKIYGAVWNDYAEFRQTLKDAKPGQVVIDNDDGSLSLTTERLQIGAQVVTDTFGFAIGETENTKTPLAVSGRVLVNTYRNRYEYHAGQSVCSAPNGTVDIMSRDEIMMYPDAIVGIVSEIPEYEVWGEDNVPVNGRIWIRVR